MNNLQELQQKFILFLVQEYVKILGEKGLKAKQQEFMLAAQGGGSPKTGVMARFGTKLEYLKKLKGMCPEGYEQVFLKQGGSICKVCQKGEKLKEKQIINKNDTVHINNKPYDLTGKHKQYPKLTNDKYRKLPTSKKTDIDLKDLARKDKCGAKLKKKK